MSEQNTTTNNNRPRTASTSTGPRVGGQTSTGPRTGGSTSSGPRTTGGSTFSGGPRTGGPASGAGGPSSNRGGPGGGNRRGGGRPQRRGNFRNQRQTEFTEKVIKISRVTTVVKGGRRFSFSAIVVVGNKKGKIGWGHGKANEVPDAIKKAVKDAQKRLIQVPIIKKRTIPHEQIGNFLASKVLIKPAPKGRGIIAGGTVRAVVELAGYTDIYSKSFGSRNSTNVVKATIAALLQLRTIEQIAAVRDKKVSEILT